MSRPKPFPAAWHIARASEHDLLEIVEIEHECRLSLWGWDGYYQEITKEPSAYMFVARLATPVGTPPQVGGFITSRLVADEVHIHNFGVRPAYRRLGLGSALLHVALEFGAQNGALSSFLEVRIGNVAAQALYRQHGFAVVGVRKNYYDYPTEDAVTMSTTLPGFPVPLKLPHS